VLRGIDGKAKIDLNALPIIEAYESGARSFDIVPGFGRLSEDEFIDTNAFGAVFRGLDGQIASVGTMMEVQAHDVVVDGRLLSVCAKGTRRFKILRVAQTEPYVVVDAVPIEDDEQSSIASPDHASAAAVNEVFDLMKTVDPYYMEAIGLEDVSKSDVKDMNEFDLANVMYYTHPTLALKLLASKDAALRRRVILASAQSFKRAIELGFTPRKSRLLASLMNLALLFGLGFTILAIKNALDGDASGLDDFY
jgi:Lon protease-like protein